METGYIEGTQRMTATRSKPKKYERTYDKILAQYGEMPAGTMLPTESKLAEDLGVSKITVTKALNLLKEHGIIERRQRKGTFTTDPKSRGRTQTIGLLVPYPFSSKMSPYSFNGQIEMGIQEVLMPLDYSILTMQAKRSDGMIVSPDQFRRRNIDGLIALGIMNPHYMAELIRTGMPVVGVEYHFENEAPTDYITEDCENRACAAIKLLIRQGHRRIAFFGKDAKNINPVASPEQGAMEHAMGMRRAFHETGTPMPEELVYAHRPLNGAIDQSMENMLALDDPPTAVFCHGNTTKLVLNYLADSEISPDDYPTIMATGTEFMGDYIRHRCWRIIQDPLKMGHAAAQSLLGQMEDPNRRPKTFRNDWWICPPGASNDESAAVLRSTDLAK